MVQSPITRVQSPFELPSPRCVHGQSLAVNRRLFDDSCASEDCINLTQHIHAEHQDVPSKCPDYVKTVAAKHVHECACRGAGTAKIQGRLQCPKVPRARKVSARRPGAGPTRTAYHVFAKQEHARLKLTGLQFGTRSQLVAASWRALDHSERSSYEKMAEQEREQMQQEQQKQEFAYLTSGFSSMGRNDELSQKMANFAQQLSSEGFRAQRPGI